MANILKPIMYAVMATHWSKNSGNAFFSCHKTVSCQSVAQTFFTTSLWISERSYHQNLVRKLIGTEVFKLKKKKFKHLSPTATWVCQNLMRLNAALTWQIDLKWKKFRDECFQHQHLFFFSHKYRISHFFLFCSSPGLFFPVLSWWLVQLRGARVWKRPTEGWWGLSYQSVSQV